MSLLPDPVDPVDPPYEEPPAPTDPGTDSGTSGGAGSGDVVVTSGSRTLGTVSATSYSGGPGAQYTLSGSYTGNTDHDSIRKRTRVYKNGVTETSTANGTTTATSASWDSNDNSQTDPICQADNNQYSWRARAYNNTESVEVNGDTLYFRSAAIAATASTPVAPAGASLEATQAYISCACYPNTLHSTATLQLQYKRSVDSTWVDFGTSDTTGGYTETTIGRQLTGLTPSTNYDTRLKITRTTVNEAGPLYSATRTFTTPASDPTITTVAASSVGAISGTINGTVDTGGESSVTVKFKWGTAADLAGGTTVTYGTVTADGNVSYNLTGLSNSTTYYFRAEVYWGVGGVSGAAGSILSFATTADPSAESIEEDMLPIQDFDRKYGVQTTIYFVVAAPAASSSNLFYTGSAVWAASGESKISKDGGAFADTTNDPAQVEGALYSLTLTATEMQCNEAYIVLNEAGATAARDVLLRVRTHLQLGSVDIDAATGAKANTTALTVTGYGSGHGLSAVAGATGQEINGVLGDHVHRGPLECQATTGTSTEIKLDSSASGTDDFYNGCIVSVIAGTAAYQSRVITDYNGTTKVATVHKAFNGNPTTGSYFVVIPGPDVWEIPNTAELATVPAVTGTMRQLLTFVWQRFKFKRTMTATAFTMYKDDGSTALGSGATVTDDGTTQTHGEYS